nr:hypothetical protein CFP56_73177 [Quercus suber]
MEEYLQTPVVLSMEVDHENEDESEYRIQMGEQIRYVKVAPNTFASDILSFPLGHFPMLPFHDQTWNVAHISRDVDSGQLQTLLSLEELATVQNIWHSAQINVQHLQKTELLKPSVFEAVLPPSAIPRAALPYAELFSPVVVAKIARFDWDIPRIERETRAYQLLHQQRISNIAPRFLGHVREGGRVIGFILEKLHDHRPALIDDLEDCSLALGTFHASGFLHGDVNRYNFLVGASGVKLVDFERLIEDASPEMQREEMNDLRAELLDETSSKGGGFMPMNDDV